MELHFEHTAIYGNRYGFVHETTLVCSDGRTFHNKIQYHNRTWEAYPFQSVKRGAVYMLIEDDVNKMIDEYKKANGFYNEPNEINSVTNLFGETENLVKKQKRLPKGLKADFEKQCKEKYMDFYNKI